MCEVSFRKMRKMFAIKRSVCSSCLSRPMVQLGYYWILIEKLLVGNILLNSADSIKFLLISDKSKPLCTKTCLHFWYLASYEVTSRKTAVKNVVYSCVYWVKRNQFDATYFIILFNAEHVSDVNTTIFRSLRLIRSYFMGCICKKYRGIVLACYLLGRCWSWCVWLY